MGYIDRMKQITLSVPDISCGHCKSSIENAVASINGVARAEVSVTDRTVDVEYDPSQLDLTAIITAIDGQGFEVEGQ
jgi:copper chaperone